MELRNKHSIISYHCRKGESIMAKVEAISHYRIEQNKNTMIEIPVVDEDNQAIMEMNLKLYINALSDILVKYASNFKAGQAVGVYLCLQYIIVFCKRNSE